MEHYVISTDWGGIGNKLKCLISALRFSKISGRKLMLSWPKKGICYAKFSNLFENKILEIDKKQLKEIVVKKDCRLYGDSSNLLEDPHKYIIFNHPEFILLPKDKKYKLKSMDGKFEKTPKKLRDEFLSCLRELKPHRKISEKIKKFSQKCNLNELVGVHIRKDTYSDITKISTDEKFIKRMEEILNEKPKQKFFLCTDSEEIEKKFLEIFKDKIIFFPKTTRNIKNPQENIEAVIDILLLSKTKHILGTHFSTFTEIAWWFGGCKAKIEIMGDEKKKQQFMAKKEYISNLNRKEKLKRYLRTLFSIFK